MHHAIKKILTGDFTQQEKLEKLIRLAYDAAEMQIADEEIRLDESKSLALFRIVQETLNNVAKHAQADRVEIVLNNDAAAYVMRVRDNGTGFDTNKNKKGSFGLIGMQERALMHGGTAFIGSHSGGGAEIVVRIPAD